MKTRNALKKIANACAVLGLLLLLASLYIRLTIPAGEYRSLGSIGSFSIMEGRDGILFSNHVMVWHKLNLVYPAALLIASGLLYREMAKCPAAQAQ